MTFIMSWYTHSITRLHICDIHIQLHVYIHVIHTFICIDTCAIMHMHNAWHSFTHSHITIRDNQFMHYTFTWHTFNCVLFRAIHVEHTFDHTRTCSLHIRYIKNVKNVFMTWKTCIIELQRRARCVQILIVCATYEFWQQNSEHNVVFVIVYCVAHCVN